MTKSVRILDRTITVHGDDDYLREIGEEFEPDNIALLRHLCDKDSRILDVGANIGMTALAFSQISSAGQIAAIEPVPRTFEFLQQNVAEAGAPNVKVFNFALGSSAGSVIMQGHPSNFACSFVADNYTIPTADHFSFQVPVKRLDDTFSELSLDRLDFMKVDVEGFELEVFAGAKKLLEDFSPSSFSR